MASKRKQKREAEPTEDDLVAVRDLVAMMPPEAHVEVSGEILTRDAICRHLGQLIAILRAERRETHGGLYLVPPNPPRNSGNERG